MIKLKDDTINPRGLSTEALLGIIITEGVLAEFGSDLTITSLNDGKHSRTSRHYAGTAWDVRTWGIKGKEEIVCQKLREALGLHYFVLFEGDHIHISYKPQRED